MKNKKQKHNVLAEKIKEINENKTFNLHVTLFWFFLQ